MNTRDNSKRSRNLLKEQSLRNPLFLQLHFAIETVKSYFQSLSHEHALKIYDFGCGEKPYQVFIEKHHQYIGLDINKNNDKADIHTDITCVPIEDNVADIVTSFYVLEHVEDPQKVVNEKYRVLKHGGQLFMLIPLYWEEHEQPYDFFRFTRFGIEKILQNAGFKNIEVSVVNTSHAILGIHLARLLNRRFFRMLVPIVNYIFYRLEIRIQKKSKKENITLSNVMTFAVRGVK